MNMYTAKDLHTVINWMGHDKLLEFLDEKEIFPAHRITTAKRTYRLYDEAALTKCKALRLKRDTEMELAKKPAAPEAPQEAQPYAPSVAALHLAVERMAEEVTHIRKQIDTLVKELGGKPFDDEGVSAGGTA
jgi:DNA-binding transcriptional MerR regulator